MKIWSFAAFLIFFVLGLFLAPLKTNISKILFFKKTAPVLDFGFKATPYPLKNHPFVIIIVGRNNGATLEKTLNSTLSQKYDNFRIIYIDDGSTDGSAKLARDILYASDAACHVQCIENPSSLGINANLVKAIHSCQDEEIVALLQEDDFLAHEWVLEKINQYFINPDVWFTFTSAMQYPSFTPIPPPSSMKEDFEKEKLHKTSFLNFYLPCFYAKLFKQIDPSDITKTFPENHPLTYIIPMLEMGEHHFHYIPAVLYLTTTDEKTPSRLETKHNYPTISQLFRLRETPL